MVRLMRAYLAATKGDVNGRDYRQFMARVRGEVLRDGVTELQKVSVHFFLTFLARQEHDALHEDFRSQSLLCGFGDVAYAFVGKVETFERDVAHVDSKLGMRGRAYERDHTGDEGEEEARRVFRVPRMRAKAVKLYADDLRHFDYAANDLP